MRDLLAIEIQIPPELMLSLHPSSNFGPPYTLRIATECSAPEFEAILEGLARVMAASADIMGRDE